MAKPNLLEQAINCDDGDHAAKMIRNALGIESDDVANYVFPKTWPANRNSANRKVCGSGDDRLLVYGSGDDRLLIRH
jgi:hypothetical protein